MPNRVHLMVEDPAKFVPSFLNYRHWIPAQIVQVVSDFTKSTNFLYLFIAAVIVGSLLSMNRGVLIRGFVRLFVPMAAASLASLCWADSIACSVSSRALFNLPYQASVSA